MHLCWWLISFIENFMDLHLHTDAHMRCDLCVWIMCNIDENAEQAAAAAHSYVCVSVRMFTRLTHTETLPSIGHWRRKKSTRKRISSNVYQIHAIAMVANYRSMKQKKTTTNRYEEKQNQRNDL